MTTVLDPLFAAPWSSPFLPGEGPFRQKGNGYIGDLDYLDANLAGGRKAAIDAIASEAMRKFLTQRFVSSEWYDAYPCAVLHATAARLRGVAFTEHQRRRCLSRLRCDERHVSIAAARGLEQETSRLMGATHLEHLLRVWQIGDAGGCDPRGPRNPRGGASGPRAIRGLRVKRLLRASASPGRREDFVHGHRRRPSTRRRARASRLHDIAHNSLELKGPCRAAPGDGWHHGAARGRLISGAQKRGWPPSTVGPPGGRAWNGGHPRSPAA